VPDREAVVGFVVDGKSIIMSQKFRKFTSLAEPFDQHGKLLANRDAYRPTMAVSQDPEAFADALTGCTRPTRNTA
jgi:flagellum-specific peptidoglycan hydrolase FlgJ